jgi:RNA polymerase sigma-70 factor (ECF subfamily)
MQLERTNSKMTRLESIEFTVSEKPPDEVQEEKYNALHSCIASLNKADQSIMILYLEELPYKKIAIITGLTENHIAVKMKRIRKLLFDCITPKLK